MEYNDLIIGYFIIAVVVGFFAFNQIPNGDMKKNVISTVIIGLFWPVVVGIIIIMLLDDLKNLILYGEV